MNKRILSSVLIIALIISAFCVSAAAVSNEDFKLVAPSDVTVDGKTNQTVEVTFAPVNDINVRATAGTFSVDESAVSYFTFSDSRCAYTVGGINEVDTASGHFQYIDIADTGINVAANGSIVTAIYTVAGNTPSGDYTISLTKALIKDSEGSQFKNATYTATIKVTNTYKPTVDVESVTLSESKLDMFVGDSETLTATVLPAEATEKDVTWTSSDASVATVVNGKVTAVGAGDATITATAGGKRASCKVTVSTKTPEPVLITGITLKDTSMKVGDKKTLTAVIEPTDATNQALRWSIVNSEIASIDETTGVVTALKEGTTTVTVKATDGSGVSATCKVTVTKKDSTIVTPGDDTGAGVIAGGAIIGALGNGSLPFNDVTARDYFYDAVKWAVDQGITSGTSRNTFSPAAPCTRAQVVTFLWRANGQPAAGNSGFLDVSSNAYYARAVDWAFANGITTGMDYGAFGPDTACTRAQIVTFLYRAR